MKGPESTFFLFSNLDGATIVLGALSIAAAAISLYTGILESKDKRKKILGMSVRDIKRIFSYASFILTILTIIVQDKHDSDSKLAEASKERVADSIQRKNLDTTLTSIGYTLRAQKITLAAQKVALDSTDTILNRQRSQLAYQVAMLRKQQLTLESNTRIIEQEKQISLGVGKSIDLIHNTLDSEIKVLAAARRTNTDLQSLTNPNNFGVEGDIKFFTAGAAEIWNPAALKDSIVYYRMKDIQPFINKYVRQLSDNAQRPLWNFFNNMSADAFEREFLINYSLNNSSGQISYVKWSAYDFSNFLSPKLLSDLRYNARENYFLLQGGFNCGNIKLNKGNIENFTPLINHSTLYIKFKYGGNRTFLVPSFDESKKKVSIDHIAIDLKVLKYGGSFQYQVILDQHNTSIVTNRELIRQLFDDNVDEKEIWRYCVIKIVLNKI